MTRDIRSRLRTLIGLTALGVVLAGAGTALGVAGPLGASGPEFVVSGENVTFSDADGDVTVVANASDARRIEIEKRGRGRFAVGTETERPLTAAERERAIDIATGNETVRRHLRDVSDYSFTVEPIRKLETTSVTNVSGNTTTVEASNGTVYRFENGDGDEGDGGESDATVAVERDPEYVEDLASVRVRQPETDDRTALKYTVTVDLADGTVADVTDWDAIRRRTD
ncbi:hypothetical protein [Halomicrobium urmianum]|uniref:hypothetical protein n=1 Tax=Halomicrobium urmianum TaxID=1586233 RepID=UPI001CD95435|nr:hypothetical protein [Halomicrobium urmianum]